MRLYRLVLCLTIMAFMLPAVAFAQGSVRANINLVCEPGNDLYRLLAADGETWNRFDDLKDAIRFSPPGYGILVLAAKYPDTPTEIGSEQLDEAAAKNIRLYVEFPNVLPGLWIGKPRQIQGERIVASTIWLKQVPTNCILSMHEGHFVPIEQANPFLSLSTVAGYDTAVNGLPDWKNPRDNEAKVFPLLNKHPLGQILVSSTKLSNFITGRYAPLENWRLLWQQIITWTAGKPFIMRTWLPSVFPTCGAQDPISSDVEEQAWRRSSEWFFDSRLLVHENWLKTVKEAQQNPQQTTFANDDERTIGNGKLGILQGFSSQVDDTGRQAIHYDVRGDSSAEVAMALALAGSAANETKYRETAANLMDFVYFDSPLTKGPRGDTKSPSYGLIGCDTESGLGVYFGDDNARCMLSTMAASALLDTDRWCESLMRTLLANLRTTGVKGFRGKNIKEDDLQKNGWRHYYETEAGTLAPHQEAYLWACYLWAYKQTGYTPFLERAKAGITTTMAAYPEKWISFNGPQQERARMLLPLAWLVRIENTEEHRGWLIRIATDLLANQDVTGAIREELGPRTNTQAPPPESNDEYGQHQAPIIQQNGDPASDILYTCDFAFIGLHEAATATGDPLYANGEQKLADFLCRIQVRSPLHTELNGAWFRAFDYKRWEFWGSNADPICGAWCVESGWSQSWITSTFLLRHLKGSLWDITANIPVKKHFEKMQTVMLPEKALDEQPAPTTTTPTSAPETPAPATPTSAPETPAPATPTPAPEVAPATETVPATS